MSKADFFEQEGWWKKARKVVSPHFNLRPSQALIELIVIHSISLPPGQYENTYIDDFFTGHLDRAADPYFAEIANLKVSSHFVINRKGLTTQYVATHHRAWHAGVSSWQNKDNCNDWSIGIELEGLEGQHFTAAQYDELALLMSDLVEVYPIRWVAGHSHIAPLRKQDPGAGFDWVLLKQKTASLSLKYPD